MSYILKISSLPNKQRTKRLGSKAGLQGNNLQHLESLLDATSMFNGLDTKEIFSSETQKAKDNGLVLPIMSCLTLQNLFCLTGSHLKVVEITYKLPFLFSVLIIFAIQLYSDNRDTHLSHLLLFLFEFIIPWEL